MFILIIVNPDDGYARNAPASTLCALIPLEWRFDSVMIVRSDYATGVERLKTRGPVHDRWVRDEVKVSGEAESIVVVAAAAAAAATDGRAYAGRVNCSWSLAYTTGGRILRINDRNRIVISRSGAEGRISLSSRSARLSCARSRVSRGLLDNAPRATYLHD